MEFGAWVGLTGSTSIPHDSELTTDVGQCWDAGCYGKSIKYTATMRQIVALIEMSSICTQTIKVRNINNCLEFC